MTPMISVTSWYSMGFNRMIVGDDELPFPAGAEPSELELLKNVQEEYTKRLLEKIPKYRAIPPDLIPDMFLLALRNRERKLTSDTSSHK